MSSLLARSNEIRHPLGGSLRTPLLVPSFSSKGFGRSGAQSEISEIFDVAKSMLTTSMLVSAYDLHHANLEWPTRGIAEFTFLDSGGYETSDLQDLSSAYAYRAEPDEWSVDLHRKTLTRWPEHLPAIFVSYDSAAEPLSLRDQVSRAIDITEIFSKQLHAFLVKPEPGRASVDPGAVLAHLGDLSRFHILGVTEKELGDSFITRMKALATLRIGMDTQGLHKMPIHVFGSLDPVSVCLYFIAGAEIFDGLTWLRYAYALDTAMYRQNAAVLEGMLTRRDDRVKVWSMTQNLGKLDALTERMRRFLNERDYRQFAHDGDWLFQAKELLRTEFAGREL